MGGGGGGFVVCVCVCELVSKQRHLEDSNKHN